RAVQPRLLRQAEVAPVLHRLLGRQVQQLHLQLAAERRYLGVRLLVARAPRRLDRIALADRVLVHVEDEQQRLLRQEAVAGHHPLPTPRQGGARGPPFPPRGAPSCAWPRPARPPPRRPPPPSGTAAPPPAAPAAARSAPGLRTPAPGPAPPRRAPGPRCRP